MAELRPYPFTALVRRMFRELAQSDSVFDLPARQFVRGDQDLDLSVRFHRQRASSPLGPAAGPQTQMAQNVVLSWLGGCRIMELKTVQILDELEIPRPCIDVHTVGLNAEWSQELKLEQSLDEYVKGAMLVEMLRAEALPPAPGFGDVVYDMSVGYDLAGVASPRVAAFIRGMQDAQRRVDEFRSQIPPEFARLCDLDFPTRLSDTLTLSTFHGCPPAEIERIIDHLMREHRLHSIIKFNPMLLGPEETHGLLYDVLGYHDMKVPDSAFERDTTWEQAVEIVERLAETAAELDLGLGVKFSNTLIVENDRGFLAPGEKEVYLSGQPLHVLAMQLVRRFRRRFGNRFPISFAAGVDRQNFADAVALGLVPITVCTDLLRKGGYGRLHGYHQELRRRLTAVGATDVAGFILAAYGQAEAALERLGLAAGDPRGERCRAALERGADLRAAAGDELYQRWTSAAALLNTERYVEAATGDPRYARAATDTPPRKIGSHLELFDCITCDICVPVCPNDANFTYGSEQREIPVESLTRQDGGWRLERRPPLMLSRRHQIASFADFCNDCGNCDIFCPEDGGPYVIKPRFFGRAEDWRGSPQLDGFYLERRTDRDLALGRFDGREFRLEVEGDEMIYAGEGFRIRFRPEDPAGSATGEGEGAVDLTYCHILDYLRRAVLDSAQVNYVNALRSGESGA